MAITVEISKAELERLAEDAILAIDVFVHHDNNFTDREIGPVGWTAEELLKARDRATGLFDRAIELVRAWEEAGD